MNICENSKEMLLLRQGHNHSPHSDSFNLNQDRYHFQTSYGFANFILFFLEVPGGGTKSNLKIGYKILNTNMITDKSC